MKNVLLMILAVCLCLSGPWFAAAAADMPGMTVLDSLRDTFSPVAFDHGKHAQIADNCAVCHHEHRSGAGLPCKQCHSLTPAAFRQSVVHTFMPCKNCHGASDPENPGMPGLKTAYHRACFACHRGMAGIGSDPRGCTELCHTRNPGSTAASH